MDAISAGQESQLANADFSARARAAIRKIGYQFPDSPEGRLMKAVFGQCVFDLASKTEGPSALRYINTDLACCEICGVDAEWVRDVLRKLELI